VQFSSSNSSELAKRMWKEELVELLSWAHADVGLMWGQTDLSKWGKSWQLLPICARCCVQHRAHNLLTRSLRAVC
jgi:hypothetical protein